MAYSNGPFLRCSNFKSPTQSWERLWKRPILQRSPVYVHTARMSHQSGWTKLLVKRLQSFHKRLQRFLYLVVLWVEHFHKGAERGIAKLGCADLDHWAPLYVLPIPANNLNIKMITNTQLLKENLFACFFREWDSNNVTYCPQAKRKRW